MDQLDIIRDKYAQMMRIVEIEGHKNAMDNKSRIERLQDLIKEMTNKHQETIDRLDQQRRELNAELEQIYTQKRDLKKQASIMSLHYMERKRDITEQRDREIEAYKQAHPETTII